MGRFLSLPSPKPVFTPSLPERGTCPHPAGVEADLGASLRFDLPEGVQASRVDVKIGFRVGKLTRTCVDFRKFPLGRGPNPRAEQAAVFTAQALPKSPPIATTSIEQVGGLLGL